MGRSQTEKVWGGCIELTAGQLQVAARKPFDDRISAGWVSKPERPVLTQEGALALLELVPPQVALRGELASDGYRLAGCADLTRKLIAALQPEAIVRCILVKEPVGTMPAAALGVLLHKTCSTEQLVAWATRPQIWEWWHIGKPTVNAVSKLFGLGRDKTAAILHKVAEERADDAEPAESEVKVEAAVPGEAPAVPGESSEVA